MSNNQLISQCILCNSKNIKPLTKFSQAHLVKCSDCGMVFSAKNPSPLELDEHYKNYGRNDYLSPITIKRYNEILDSFEPARKTNRLLDVGCGIGYFLEVAKKRGWEVHGTEFTDQAIEICQSKGINMKKGVLNPQNYPAESFDVITSFEVIEHINTPTTEINNMQSLLRKEGLLYITTPNFNSTLRYLLGEKYNVICWPEHLSYYTPSTLKKLLVNQGFKVKYVHSTGISLTRLSTSKSIAQPTAVHEGTVFIAADTQDEKLRNSFEKNPLLGFAKKSVNQALTLSGKGDALKGLFIKK